MAQDINKTINLPKTDFPMRANLPAREPGMLKEFEDADIYGKLMKRNEGKPSFILHDGPPYANGDIHIGTALNKIIKDFIVRYKNMTGYYAPYVPGWDTHGMPIETAIQKKGVKRSEMPVPEFRNKCREFALNYLNRQRDEFKRLGGIGDWDHPYVTLHPDFEAAQIEVFGKMAKKGLIYKGLKPVYWCPYDETALAEAEVEYADDPVTTIFVKFRVADDRGKLSQLCDLSRTYFVIWTTTTWTLPGNMAICLNPQFDYSVVEASNGEFYILAEALADDVLAQAGLTRSRTVVTMPGTEFERMTAHHPFLDRTSLIILGDHVTLDAGSGCVHTAPAFGLDDFLVCQKYPEIPTDISMEVCVDAHGVLTEAAGPYAGIHVFKAHDAIYPDLVKSGALLSSEDIVHSYPHCWRCKKPVIFRATDQWFASVDAIKDEAVKACDGIRWKPEWGKERMISMIRERSDWCISRQRTWGVPIPIFYCKNCHEPLINDGTIAKIADIFRKEGSNAWWAHEASELLPEGTVCPKCGCAEFTKEKDIMDVWFDSGSTHAAVLAQRPELKYPADMYLEGGDQYRGWFQSSMLTSIAVNGIAPYRQIVTHGWTVDGQGRAMHKSLGNTIAPDTVIKQYGADILRLWASSADFTQDMRIDKNIMKQLSDAYLKIRNTSRYMIGNLNGFDCDSPVPYREMEELDRWALSRFNDLVAKCRDAYENYDFHLVYRAVYNFCVIDLSNVYLDVIKDRLYCEEKNSTLRRSAQTAMYYILDGMTRLLCPILAFTSQEIWKAMPHDSHADPEAVLLNDIPEVNPEWTFSPEMAEKWDCLLKLRNDVNKVLEDARAAKLLKKGLEADITVYFTEEAYARYQKIALPDDQMADWLIVSGFRAVCGSGEGTESAEFPGAVIRVSTMQAPKCQRCWKYLPAVGSDPDYPDLCPRCAAVVRSLPADLAP